MLAEIGHSKKNRHGKEQGKSQSDRAATVHVEDRCIAGGNIDEGAIGEHERLVLFEGEIALRAI